MFPIGAWREKPGNLTRCREESGEIKLIKSSRRYNVDSNHPKPRQERIRSGNTMTKRMLGSVRRDRSL
jgi:hypothetical protein